MTYKFGWSSILAIGLLLAYLSPRAHADSLSLTALAGENNKSIIECWTFSQDYLDVRGLKLQVLGDFSGASYGRTPSDADYVQGPYNPAAPQLFTILQGSATITFPDSNGILNVKSGLLYAAADTADVSGLGHITTVHPNSHLLQFPFAGGAIPQHTVQPGECGDDSG